MNKYHNHTDVFTIDISLVANPSIVSNFNAESHYKTIPDNSFDIIIFEGSGEPSENSNEIKRLLNKNNLSYGIKYFTVHNSDLLQLNPHKDFKIVNEYALSIVSQFK